MEFNNNSPQLQSENSNPTSSWGQLFSCFVLTVSLGALSESSGSSCGIHILRVWIWGRLFGSSSSIKICQIFVSSSHQQLVLSEAPSLCPSTSHPKSSASRSIHPVATLFSEGSPHREVRIHGFWSLNMLYDLVSTFSLFWLLVFTSIKSGGWTEDLRSPLL